MQCATSKSFLALPFLVIGLWKFGFPETACSIYVALYDCELSKRERVANMLDAIGLCAHHSAASMLICMILANVAQPNQAIYDSILILCIQHLFPLLRYSYKYLYIIIELALEAWFEWSVVSNFEHFLNNHWTVALSASVLLISHWLYMLSGVIHLSGELQINRAWDRKKYRISTQAFHHSGQVASILYPGGDQGAKF